MNSDGLAFTYLVEHSDSIMCADLETASGEQPKYVMVHDWPAHGVEITEEAAIFHHLVTYEPGVATIEAEQGAKAHREMLNLSQESIREDDDLTVVHDRHMAEHIVPGRTVWTETDGDTVTYEVEDDNGDRQRIHLPEIVQVFERVPFSERVYSLEALTAELNELFDAEIQF